MQPAENQCIEWKESWKDDCLQEICAFANAQGGRLHIGRNDSGVDSRQRMLANHPCRRQSVRTNL